MTRRREEPGSAISSRGRRARSAARRIERAGRVSALAVGAALLALLVGARSVPAAESDAAVRLERALADYATAQAEMDRDARIAGFQRAARGFAALVDEGAASPALFTNLGNAALQAGHVGQAVLAYHRALRLDPDDATARQNLAHVRSLLPAWVPRPSGRESGAALFVDRRIPLPTRWLAGAGCFAIAALALVLAGRRRSGAWRGLGIVSGLAWLALVASVVLEGRATTARIAVLVAEETPARTADSMLAPLALPEPLPAGVEVERLEERGDFARVRLANGRDVWVRSSSVAVVGD